MLDEAADIYDLSRAALETVLADVRRDALAPSPQLRVSEWVEANFRLSAESSAEPGPLKLYGFQRGPLDAMGDPSLWGIAVLKSARVGYTMSLKAAAAYYLEHDPAPVLIVMPTEDDAKDFVKTEIEPAFRDTPALAAIAGGGVAMDEWHTKFTRRGSVLRVRGAYSPDAFRRITSRINIGDEIDGGGWDGGAAKSQGDKVRLLRKRGETYWNSKLILGSTPTIAGASRIEEWFNRGDQRRYYVPCPHCGTMQTLVWGGRGESHGVKWPKDRPQDAYYVCINADPDDRAHWIHERHKVWMDERGEWIATNPDAEPGFASFHINALYSLFPAAAWGKLAQEFVDVMRRPPGHERREAMRTFANLVLGETFEEDFGKRVESHDLLNRLEVYTAEVPEGVLLLTAGVDTQTADGGRFEVSIYGWGANGERWLIGHWILKDHPLTDPRAWTSLEALLRRPFRNTAGREMFIQGACIDSGGTYTQEVYAFTGRQPPRLRWWAIKGRNNTKGERSSDGVWPKIPTKTGLGSLLHLVDVDTAKDTLSRQLAAENGESGCFHWPSSALPGSTPIDDLFFTRLTREKQRPAPGRPGRTFWTSPSDQEPWDCLVYAYAALVGLCSIPGNMWARQVAVRQAQVSASATGDASAPAPAVAARTAPPAPQAPAAAPKPAPRQKVISSPFMRRR